MRPAGEGLVQFRQPSLCLPRRLGRRGLKWAEEFLRGPGWRLGENLACRLHREPECFVLREVEVVFTCFWKLSVLSWHSEASVCPGSVPGRCFSVPRETKWPFAQRDKWGLKPRNLEIQLQPPWGAGQVSCFPLSSLLYLQTSASPAWEPLPTALAYFPFTTVEMESWANV